MKDYSGIKFILLFAYGEERKINRQLAEIADKMALRHGATIFTQKDMANAYSFKAKVDVAEQTGYISGLQIIDQYRKKYIEPYHTIYDQWLRTLVIAAPQHIWRCVADCRTECFEGRFYFYVYGDFFGGFPKHLKWYDSEDPQPWVRSPWVWWKKELPIRIIRFLWYSFYARKARTTGRK